MCICACHTSTFFAHIGLQHLDPLGCIFLFREESCSCRFPQNWNIKMEVLKLLRGYHRQCRLGVASETPCYGHCYAINDVFKSVMNEVFVTQYMYI